MNYVIGPVGPKFSPVVSKDLRCFSQIILLKAWSLLLLLSPFHIGYLVNSFHMEEMEETFLQHVI